MRPAARASIPHTPPRAPPLRLLTRSRRRAPARPSSPVNSGMCPNMDDHENADTDHIVKVGTVSTKVSNPGAKLHRDTIDEKDWNAFYHLEEDLG